MLRGGCSHQHQSRGRCLGNRGTYIVACSTFGIAQYGGLEGVYARGDALKMQANQYKRVNIKSLRSQDAEQKPPARRRKDSGCVPEHDSVSLKGGLGLAVDALVTPEWAPTRRLAACACCWMRARQKEKGKKKGWRWMRRNEMRAEGGKREMKGEEKEANQRPRRAERVSYQHRPNSALGGSAICCLDAADDNELQATGE